MQAWDADEVQALVTLWCDRSVQGELASSVRNEKIYAKLAVDLKELGYNRRLKQCREKIIKKLKQEYKKIKEHNNKSGADHKKGKYYDIMDSVLGHRPATLGAGVVNSATEIMEAMVDPPAEKEDVVQEDELDSSSNWTETPSSAGTLHRTTTGLKRPPTLGHYTGQQLGKNVKGLMHRLQYLNWLRS
ncbi:trihelix mRNAion factor GTL1-like isoform X1 [Huso huso]|uniref:Trihelix mRNAion factor GTL1-like isoform X1 n=1 Tax=Huso huso TaxID=61971 RepID=A0ABR0ZXQ0_HUSHU